MSARERETAKEDILITFYQVRSDDTYEMRDQTNAPLELPPAPVVAGDPGSIGSDEICQKIEKLNKMMKDER